jgi:hypothetical protein
MRYDLRFCAWFNQVGTRKQNTSGDTNIWLTADEING